MPNLTNISKSVGKMLGHTAEGIKKYKKTSLAVGGAGLATGSYILGRNTGHTASDHSRKKTAEANMTPKEKADQKYAIAKSYENEGHPRKAKEYKSKAARAYKTAWEKKAGVKSFLAKDAPNWLLNVGKATSSKPFPYVVGGGIGTAMGVPAYIKHKKKKKSLVKKAAVERSILRFSKLNI